MRFGGNATMPISGPCRATRLMNLVRSSWKRKRWRWAHTEDEEGASASSSPGATQVAPRTARDIPDPSCARARRRQTSVKDGRRAHRKRRAHHNGESVNDVRVSPIDEGVDDAEDDPCRTARRPRTGANGSPPRSSRTTRSPRRGVTEHHEGTHGPPSESTDGPLSCQKKSIKNRVNPGRTTAACLPKFQHQGKTNRRNHPPSRDGTSDEVPKLWS